MNSIAARAVAITLTLGAALGGCGGSGADENQEPEYVADAPLTSVTFSPSVAASSGGPVTVSFTSKRDLWYVAAHLNYPGTGQASTDDGGRGDVLGGGGIFTSGSFELTTYAGMHDGALSFYDSSASGLAVMEPDGTYWIYYATPGAPELWVDGDEGRSSTTLPAPLLSVTGNPTPTTPPSFTMTADASAGTSVTVTVTTDVSVDSVTVRLSGGAGASQTPGTTSTVVVPLLSPGAPGSEELPFIYLRESSTGIVWAYDWDVYVSETHFVAYPYDSNVNLVSGGAALGPATPSGAALARITY